MRESASYLGLKAQVALLTGMLLGVLGLFFVDGASLALAQADMTAPTISTVAITSDPDDDGLSYRSQYDDGVYGIGDSIEVTVTFSEDVTVTGSPQLELDVGGSAKNAAYKSTTDDEVVFSYTVASGDSDTDGIAISANKLSLNGGSVQDAASNAADLAHTALSAQAGHKVDGIRPTVTRAPHFLRSTSANDGVYESGEGVSIGVGFSEEVIVIGERPVIVMPRLTFNLGGNARIASFTSAHSGCEDDDNNGVFLCAISPSILDWRGTGVYFRYEIAKGELDLNGPSIGANSIDLNGGTIKDAAGNDAILTHSSVADFAEIVIDAAPATVKSLVITSDPGSDNAYGVGDRIEVTVTFSESVIIPRWMGTDGIRMPLLELDIGGVAKTARTHERAGITGTSAVFAYTVRRGDSDADGISIGANKLTSRASSGVMDNYSGCCGRGGEIADLSHVAVPDNANHKVITVRTLSKSNDATLSGLTLSGIDFGTFASGTESYTAEVTNNPTETTVTPTVNHSGATYVIRIGGVTDSDGIVTLAAGNNLITVEVTAEDGTTKKTYSVTVTRLVTSQQTEASTDATLSGLTLSGVDFGTFAADTTSYTASVANSVSQTTVTPTLNDSDASYVIRLGGTEDSDGTVSLAVGSNIITVEVTAEDGTTKKTYTVTVTRLVTSRQTEASTDATLSGLTLSGIDFGTFAADTTSYTASVANNVSQTTVTPTPNDSDASYVIRLGGTEDSDGTVSLAVGDNVVTVEVTAEDGTTKKTYTLTVTRLVTSQQNEASTDATLSGLTLSGVDFGSFSSGTESYTAEVTNNPTETTVTPTVNHSGATYVIKIDGVTDSDGIVTLAAGNNLITVEVTAEDGTTKKTYTVTVTRLVTSEQTQASTDATLSGLTLSGIDFGTFAADTTTYNTVVENGVTETTVAATANHTGVSLVIKLGGTETDDGTVALDIGDNIITVEVTAEDGETTLTYTVTVSRDEHVLLVGELASDAPPVNYRVTSYGEDTVTLAWDAPHNRGLTGYLLERQNHEGTEFAASDWSASGDVSGGNSATASATGLTADTLYRYDLTLKSSDGTAIIEKSLEVRTLAAGATALSSDVTLSALSLSGLELDPAFSSSSYRYAASAASDVAQTTLTATLNDSAASYAVKLGGVVDDDSTIDLSPGRNVITVTVTAEDGVTTGIYTIVVSRAKTADALSSDAALRSLSLSGIDFGAFSSDTTSYTAQVANEVSQTTATIVRNDTEAIHLIKLGGVEDTDGVIDLSVGDNIITVEVTAEDGETTLTYTTTVTRAEAPATEPEPAPADTCVQAVEADGTIEGSWDDTCLSEKDAPGGAGDRYARFYTFTLSEATEITIALESDEDTYLYLLDEHGKDGDTLHSNDDIAAGGVNLNSRLLVTLQPGDYTIEATTYHAEREGDFTLTIEGLGEAEVPTPDPEPEVEGCVESISADGTIEGSWDDSCLSDRAAPGGAVDRYSRFFTFTLDEADDVTITLESEQDTYLYLLEGHGRNETVLYENDDIDYPSNTNSRLSERLEAGDYTIEATTYYAQKSGEFTLNISGLDFSQ